MDFLIAHIYSSVSKQLECIQSQRLQYPTVAILFWHVNQIIYSWTWYKLVMFVHSCGQRHFKHYRVYSQYREVSFSSWNTFSQSEELSCSFHNSWNCLSLQRIQDFSRGGGREGEWQQKIKFSVGPKPKKRLIFVLIFVLISLPTREVM